MKKLVLLVLIAILLATPAGATKSKSCSDGEQLTGSTWYHQHCYTDRFEADTDTDTHTDAKKSTDTKLGIKLDAPNIVRITGNSTVGVEGGKDVLDTNSSEGWFAFLKFTWTGNLLDFSKKGE